MFSISQSISLFVQQRVQDTMKRQYKYRVETGMTRLIALTVTHLTTDQTHIQPGDYIKRELTIAVEPSIRARYTEHWTAVLILERCFVHCQSAE